MDFKIEVNSCSVTVNLVQKARMKHCYLRILNKNELQIKANRFFGLEDAKALIEKKRNWIEKHLKRLEDKDLESHFYYLGKPLPKEQVENSDIFYKARALELLPNLVDKHANRMELFPTALKFRKNKTRFGSCSSKNSISLNILLMKYPLEVIEYVIIHELAHIKHKNHSKRFWGLVQEYCPNYKFLDNQLKLF